VNWDEMAVVGQIARPHGIRGQVIVNLDTDFPHDRFRPGAELFVRRSTGAADAESLIIETVRFQHERPVIAFQGVDDMNAAIRLAGSELRVPVERLAPLPPATFYRHDLVGCVVETVAGARVGEVSEVEGSMALSRLVVATPGGEVLVPMVADICQSIDVAGKRIVIAPPDGLLELNTRRADHEVK
jgi:16S rRNA processing protein RimM